MLPREGRSRWLYVRASSRVLGQPARGWLLGSEMRASLKALCPRGKLHGTAERSERLEMREHFCVAQLVLGGSAAPFCEDGGQGARVEEMH